VEERDFEEAMRLTKASKESVEISAQIDKNANPLDVVYDIIVNLLRRDPSGAEGWVEIAEIVSMAGHKALSSEQVVEAIENWENLHVLFSNPEKTRVRFAVPQ